MNRRIATAIVTLALLAITGLPARASAFSAATESDLSSLPQVMDYLRAIGVDPAGVVVQQGQLNYAGPNCPGAEWNCTASNRVVHECLRVLARAERHVARAR